MKRSQVNQAYHEAKSFFEKHHWVLPPNPKWDITDFGLGDFEKYGLVLVNLAEEPEYCEKLMYARKGMRTPAHTHRVKKEDIICRNGKLSLQLWQGEPGKHGGSFPIQVNGENRTLNNGDIVELHSGERITLVPGIYHEFWPESEGCIMGEVSTANDDEKDNFFTNPNIGRYSEIEEDEPKAIDLLSD